MADVPQDIREKANSLASEWATAQSHLGQKVAKSAYEAMFTYTSQLIMAERERCARIADAHSECERDCGDVIAAAIRALAPTLSMPSSPIPEK